MDAGGSEINEVLARGAVVACGRDAAARSLPVVGGRQAWDRWHATAVRSHLPKADHARCDTGAAGLPTPVFKVPRFELQTCETRFAGGSPSRAVRKSVENS